MDDEQYILLDHAVESYLQPNYVQTPNCNYPMSLSIKINGTLSETQWLYENVGMNSV